MNPQENISPESTLYIEQDLEKAQTRLERCQGSVKNYTDLINGTLTTFPDQPRRRVMASVCGGLAYFDAVVENTNSFLVLLGDGWFAERSAKQCTGIATRRLEFLKNEEKMFAGQIKQLKATLDVARQEMAMMNNGEGEELPGLQRDGGGAIGEDEFDECDQLNLRELEALEEEMLRDTQGGEWTEEILSQKVKERQIAKKKRRLEEESKAQKTVSEALMDTAAKATGNLSSSSLGEEKKSLANSAIPQHPGQVGIIEQLEMLNSQMGKNSTSNNNTSSNKQQENVETAIVEKKQSNNNETASKQEQPVQERKADGTGSIMERNCGVTAPKSQNSNSNDNMTKLTSSTNDLEEQHQEEPPKKVSLFKQRKAGGSA